METKVILFDFFGVLSTPCYYPIIRTYVKKSLRDKYVKKLDDLDIGSLPENELVELISKASKLSIDEINHMADTVPQLNYDLINYIKKNIVGKYKVGLLTNIPSSRLNKLFENYLENFDPKYISSELKMIKPNKDIFEYVIKDLRIEPSSILFIDDSDKNIKVAKELGIDAIKHEDNIKTFAILKKKLAKK